MKKLSILVLAVLCLFLAGCSNEKVVLSGAEFVAKAKEAGYTSSDIRDMYNTFAESAYMITSEFKVIYVEGKNVYDIEGLFFDECKNITNSLSSSGTYKANNGGNWSSFEATDIGDYYYVSLVDNTYIYIKGKPENKERIKALVDTLGY